MNRIISYNLIILFVAGGSCFERGSEHLKLFEKVKPSVSGIDFANNLQVRDNFDVFRYRNYYNGGGVAIGDINNDGLADIYFTANQNPNKLFLNMGDFRFKDITEKAGVGGLKAWSTGVTFADVNSDGWLDIYVCNSGNIKGDNRANELFINNGDLTFTEAADKYNLDAGGHSTHSAFFDYDNDGDLDLYLLNNSFIPVVNFIKHGYKNTRHKRDSLGGDKLYRNDGGFFKDVTEGAGIFSSVIGFGLGVTVGDINRDGWQDIYVSNDFFERDYLYINQQNGKYSEELESRMGHISLFSMGADMADINNDGYPEIFVTDMLPADELRLKEVVGYESYDVYETKIAQGYHHQYMRNMLHLNIPVPDVSARNADRSFIEIGQIANVNASDWSWGALIADFNNDGLKDIFVDNGIYKDVTNRDFIDFFADEQMNLFKKKGTTKDIDFSSLLNRIPTSKLNNFLFINSDGTTFKELARESGINDLTCSNGSAYGDLDNDGDLDLVVNNVNMTASVYRNNATMYNGNNYLKIKLRGGGKNRFAVGSKVTVFMDSMSLYQELMPMRGFQSSSDYNLLFGMGKSEYIDSIKIIWPDGNKLVKVGIAANQSLTFEETETKKNDKSESNYDYLSPLFKKVKIPELTDFFHREDYFTDFDYERLIPHKISTEGPAFAAADINEDGVKDFFTGGAKGFEARLYVSTYNGFVSSNAELFKKDKDYEDTDAVFLDYDSDGDLDLYVGSGGNHPPYGSQSRYDRLYVNQGHGDFSKTQSVIPNISNYTAVVSPCDYDNDGDLDLFIGSRAVPGKYGETPRSYLFINNEGLRFTESTSLISFDLGRVGMVTDAIWSDYDSDGDYDLFVVGEWMGIKVFNNDKSSLTDISESLGLKNTNGWWNTIAASDLDNDGDVDFVVGNRGLNSFLKPSPESPLKLHFNDFDQNGSWEPIISYSKDGKYYPILLKDEITTQISSLKKRYLKFENYAGQTIDEIFTEDQIKFSITKEVHTFSSVALLNDSGKGFVLKKLPFKSQLSPVNAIYTYDFDNDGIKDIMLGGNFFGASTRFGRFDANMGQVLIGQGGVNFKVLDPAESGLFHKKVVKGIEHLSYGSRELFVLAFNNDSLRVYELLNKTQ